MVLSEQQDMVRELARDYAQERVVPFARQWEADAAIPPEILSEMGAMGFMGATVSQDEGGAGLDYGSYALALMEIAAGDGALSTIMSVNNAPVCAILESVGTRQQKDAFLRRLASGSAIGAFALTESHAGSDAADLRTRARRDGDRYVIDGTKQFVTSGRIAGVTVVFAVTDPDLGKRGISAFLVPAGARGLTISRVEEKMGQCASDTVQLNFESVEVPCEYRLGDEGGGYRIALSNLETGRIGIAAQSVGMAQAALECAIAYCGERRSFGVRLMDHQAVSFRLADAATRLEAARALVLRAAAMKDARLPCMREASMAKLFASEAAEKVVSDSLQCLGGYGYTRDFPIEKIARDVRVCQIYEGTSDIQRMLIARSLCVP